MLYKYMSIVILLCSWQQHYGSTICGFFWVMCDAPDGREVLDILGLSENRLHKDHCHVHGSTESSFLKYTCMRSP